MRLTQAAAKTKQQFNIPDVVDLFSGCGGLSYGFHLAGFEVASGLEIDEHACNTASYNLHWKLGHDKEHLCEDIRNINASDLISGNKRPLITIGGPPCQAYSRIGKSKIKSLGEHRFGLNDQRAFLYQEFIRVGLELESDAIIMENVPEAVNFFGRNIPQMVCNILERNGYNAIWTILNSADFGVPQTRERVFVIAIKKEIGKIYFLPEPTHQNPLEKLNEKIQSKYNKFSTVDNFRMPIIADNTTPKWVTSHDALSDLPALFPSSASKYKLHKMNTKMPYQTPPLNAYQKKMRSIYENKYSNLVDANCFRKTGRDFRIFERMKQGDDYRDAFEIAIKLFEDACKYYNVSKAEKEAYARLKKEYVPPYDNTKFHSKWKKLQPDKPSHTLVAHLGTDTYSHIHPYEPRGISVREAARLQSFPDSFIFNVPMGSAFKQIGNAVPPLLAMGVAKAVLKNINL
ncbi:DNA cytosine methyltransferase [Bacillus benzoevorans]|uniref:DNA (cytosine-5-)-methyltransferase n=1 Tax=Bacillus benzoevorans TaxID=1456 RepID=A0A7X0LXH8_9BACI|nr:DNA cytosine methyltransferase [Bacillus benzoevorans]MBB6447793.1 DNA (cytosine-5)-methyltransferase 1 [Bacillus benzoevorans]